MSHDPGPLETRVFPDRIAELGFSMRLPPDWISHPLPEEELNFDNPTQMVPLAIVTAPHAAIVWAVAARPGYGEGTLLQWAHYLAGESGLSLRAVGGSRIGELPAIVGEAVQDSDLGPMRVRFAFLEDGGRLVNLTLTAPELLADAVYGVWTEGLASLRLETPRGATVELGATID